LEGFELMLRFLQEKKFTRSGALRVFNHAVANHSRNCERLIETGCLKHLFPAVMGKKRYKTLSTNKNQLIQKEEENVMSILASLCLYIDSKSPFNAYERLHVKFVENEFEKIDRFIDIFQKYSQRMEKITQIDEKELIEEEEKEELYLQKLDAGLFILQCVSFCLAHCCAFSVKIHAYVQLKFHERAIESEALENVLQEQLKMLGKDTKESEKQKMRLEELLVELHKKNSIQEQPIEEEEKQETQ
jgi:beta-catenin-like protein 1